MESSKHLAAGGNSAPEFLETLARALHVYGLPSHRLEETLTRMSQALGVDAQFLVTPTAVISSVGDTTHLTRVDQGQTNLERLADLNDIMIRVGKHEIEPSEGTRCIRDLEARAARYGAPTTLVAFVLASATAAILFGGGWRESAGAGTIGGLIGLLSVVSGRSVRLERLVPVLAGLLAALVAQYFATIFQPMFAFLATLAGLIILIPGLSLTIAMNELAHNHLVSGTARLMGSTMMFLQLGFGAAMGWRLAPVLWGPTSVVDPLAVPVAATWLMLPVASLAFVVLFRAHPRDYLPILLGATMSYATSRWASDALGPEVGMAFGAWVLGCVSKLIASVSRRPAAIPLLPGLLILVPGTLGIRSLQALFLQDVFLGVQTAFTMTLIAVALVTGLFLANLTLRSRTAWM